MHLKLQVRAGYIALQYLCVLTVVCVCVCVCVLEREHCHCCTLLFVRALTLTDGETTWIMAEEREGGDREQRRWKEDGGGGGGFVHRPGGGVCVCAPGHMVPRKKAACSGCLPARVY